MAWRKIYEIKSGLIYIFILNLTFMGGKRTGTW
jgi:hypothetical protein